ncbi:CubicO group peptidase, beta-lactamase class C family [Chitinophaga sp. CF118]|uniref:serine hydrolase domain-containing protein n=1 Tax=Chitinophaga sp. CF118 TaxID=1884367 RepID=UPI0008F4485C|nr:serine hydrolase domain-containing protein [Chitinophaga sp. CF118]SFD87950.1 CubicO group peptidase, beta-lactamase class C family [Chitinophaga sp. CF118]
MKRTIAIVFLLYCYTVKGQSYPEVIREKSYKAAISKAEKFIDSLQAKQDIPGISVCVGSKEKILWAEGFGFADLENKTRVGVHSKFRMGSVSKLLTIEAIGLLYQEGKLDLDAPIQKYLPGFPEKKYPITSRQLAGHTAGIRHYRKSDPLSIPKRYKSVDEGLSIFKDDSLLFKPGTAYAYSTFGYSLLSAVAEAASHTDFLSFMRDSIFFRLGMTNTIADYSDSIVPGRVRFYEHSEGKLVNAALVDNSYKWAGGGFLSTPFDLVNMVRGLLNHTLLDEKTVELLFTSQHLDNGEDTHVGIGWRINTDSKGRRIIHHGGLIDGGRTFLLSYPEQGIVVAIAANMSGVNINLKEAETLAGYFLNMQKL